jgi:hypothetical protein
MLEGSNLADRLRRISESKTAEAKKKQFLQSDYGYPSFLALHKTLQRMSEELKNYNIDITMYLTTPDGFDDDKYRKSFIYIESEGGNFGIEYIEKKFEVYDPGDDVYDSSSEWVISPGIDIFYNYNNLKNEPVTKQAYYIAIDDHSNVTWGHFTPMGLANDIAERIVAKMENNT